MNEYFGSFVQQKLEIMNLYIFNMSGHSCTATYLMKTAVAKLCWAIFFIFFLLSSMFSLGTHSSQQNVDWTPCNTSSTSSEETKYKPVRVYFTEKWNFSLSGSKEFLNIICCKTWKWTWQDTHIWKKLLVVITLPYYILRK